MEGTPYKILTPVSDGDGTRVPPIQNDSNFFDILNVRTSFICMIQLDNSAMGEYHGGIILIYLGLDAVCDTTLRPTSTTPPLAWATWRWSTAYITYSCLLTCFEVSSGSSGDQLGVGDMLASLTTIVKECCGCFILIIHRMIEVSI